MKGLGAAVLLAAGLATDVAAAAPPGRSSSLVVSAEPSIELLGVVRSLAGLRVGPLPPGFEDFERRFGRFRSHPAVASYRAIAAERGGRMALAMLALFWSAPPSLAPRADRPTPPIHLVRRVGEARLQRLLSQLRDLAAASGFAAYWREHAGDYRRHEEALRRELAGRGDVGAVEAYVGRGLDGRVRLIPCLLYDAADFAYVIPYPYGGPGLRVPGPYEVVIPVRARRFAPELSYGFTGAPGDGFRELLSAFVDGEMTAYDTRRCAPGRIEAAIEDRLAGRGPLDIHDDDPSSRASRIAVAARLREYESDRKRYPDLASFFPRLFEACAGAPVGGR